MVRVDSMPAAHADLASAAALAAANEHRPARTVEVGLGRGKRFADPQACAPQITISARRRAPSASSPAARMTAMISSIVGGSAGSEAPCCAELARGDSQASWRASGDDERHPATDFPCLLLHRCWSDPPILAFSLRIGKGLMTISMPDRFRLAAPRGRRRRIGMAIGLLEQSRLGSCRRPGRTKSTRLARRRIALRRLEWPPRVARARPDGRGGSCASGRPRDVGPRCERWRALERDRDAAFEPPLASQVLLGIKQLEPNGQALLRRPDCVRGHSGPPGVGGLPSAY